MSNPRSKKCGSNLHFCWPTLGCLNRILVPSTWLFLLQWNVHVISYCSCRMITTFPTIHLAVSWFSWCSEFLFDDLLLFSLGTSSFLEDVPWFSYDFQCFFHVFQCFPWFPMFSHDVPMFSYDFLCFLHVFPPFSHYFPMIFHVFPRFSQRFSMFSYDFPWFFHDFPMCSDNVPMFSYDFPWFSYVSSMTSCCFPRDVAILQVRVALCDTVAWHGDDTGVTCAVAGTDGTAWQCSGADCGTKWRF